MTLSIGTPVVAYSYLLNANPGWLTDGDWAFGHPQGQAGDPTTAYTGQNVYGYNLAGAYGNSLPPQHLTTLPMNCTGLSRVTLDFARWLGVESASWDGASIAVSTDGNAWNTVWSHTGDTLVETAWSLQSYNVGTVADDQPFVQFRWTMGPTDSADTYCGWNLDDIQVLAIGTPQANQPPLAQAIQASTAKNTPMTITLLGSDANLDPITYTIVSLPLNGELTDPNAGLITVRALHAHGRRTTPWSTLQLWTLPATTCSSTRSTTAANVQRGDGDDRRDCRCPVPVHGGLRNWSATRSALAHRFHRHRTDPGHQPERAGRQLPSDDGLLVRGHVQSQRAHAGG